MDKDKSMEEARGVICSGCRQRFSVTADQCPTCHTMNPLLAHQEKYITKDQAAGTNQRGVICSGCRQRFSATADQCPTCHTMNPLLAHQEKYITKDLTGTNEKSSTKWFGGKIANKLKKGRSDYEGLAQVSLNCKPSPLDVPEYSSSSGWRWPRKRALLIGVSYSKDRKHRLKGTINDVMNMRSFLIINCGFREENIVVLTEEEPEQQHIPTKRSILRALQWLVQGCKTGDSLVFYFSGHGVRQPDFEGDERDGFDETICPVDFMTEGLISDNEINSILVWPLRKGVTLHAIVDACHSGTILDLMHVYNRKKKVWEDNGPPSGKARKHTDGGLAISISACEDNQKAADTSALTGKEMNGALTHILIDTVKKHPGPIAYSTLLDLIQERLDLVNKNVSIPVRILNRIFHNKILQRPQLSASEPFDVEKKLFRL